jgi:RHS repeat-associated protein
MLCQVNVANGETKQYAVDLRLPGYIPLEITRSYSNATKNLEAFGYGWTCSLQPASLQLVGDRLLYRSGPGSAIEFRAVPVGQAAQDEAKTMTLENQENEYRVFSSPLLKQVFPKSAKVGILVYTDRLEDLNGNCIRFYYDEWNRVIRIIDTCERRIFFAYSGDCIAELHIGSTDNPKDATRVMAYRYDNHQDLIAVIDAAGHTSTYEYANHLLIKHTNRLGGSYATQYDQLGRCIRIWQDDGRMLRLLDFDDTRRVTRVTDSAGYQTIYRHDERGQQIEELSPFGESKQTFYDNEGRFLGTTTAYGIPATVQQADPDGKTLKQVDGDGNTTVYRYNDYGQVISRTDTSGNEWCMEYDSRGNAIRLTSPLGSVWQFERNRRGMVTQVISPEDRRTQLARSADHSTLTVEDDLGVLYRHYYNVFGWLIERLDAIGRRQRRLYDTAGNLTEIVFDDGSRVRYQYDAEGNPIAVIDALNQESRLVYDKFGRPTVGIRPDGTRLAFEYDSEGRLASVTNAKGEKATYEYDWRGRVTFFTSFCGLTEAYRYERGGSRVVTRTGKGEIVSEYDELGNLLREECSDGSWRSFSYDPVGRVLLAENQDGPISFEYDLDGRTTAEHQGAASLYFSYDKDGNRTAIRDHGGRVVYRAYDQRNRVIEISDWNRFTYRFEYDPVDRLTATHFPSGLWETFDYNRRNCLIQQHVNGRGESPFERICEYDALNQLARVEDSTHGWSLYAYDAANRVVEGRHERQKSEHYAYDASGNVLTSSVFRNYYYGAGDRLLRTDSVHYQYDEAGCLAELTGNGLSRRLEFDMWGQLKRVITQDGDAWEYRYDAFGRRNAKIGPGGTITWTWENDELFSENRGEERHDYLLVGGVPVGLGNTSHHYSFVVDHLGMPCALFDLSGQRVWSVGEQTAFGKISAPALTDFRPALRFPGQYYDDETGFHYNRFRYYDPSTGRYISPDPLGLRGGPNAYAYVTNPLAQIDPLGLIGGRAFGGLVPPPFSADGPRKVWEMKVPAGKYPNKEKCWRELQQQGVEFFYNDLPRPEELHKHGYTRDRVPSASEVYDAHHPPGSPDCRQEGEQVDHCHEWALGGPHHIDNLSPIPSSENLSAGATVGKELTRLKQLGMQPGDIIRIVFV